MNQPAIKLILLLLACFILPELQAQTGPSRGWDSVKIKGTKQEVYRVFEGKPYLTDGWCLGKIEFTNGETIDSLYLKYSSYKDDIIYFNEQIKTQIRIDKATVSAFSFKDENGVIHSFRKYPFDNWAKADRYFEILNTDSPNLMCYRKVNLNEVSPYHDKSGTLKNMAYQQEYLYYFYFPDKGFSSVKPNKSSLLSHFDKDSQKAIKKILRRNRIDILDEFSFVVAWQTIQKHGFKVLF
jgi:hypothetical protein